MFDGSTTPSRIIVGSSAGVLATLDDGATWKVHGVGLPIVECMSMAFDGTVSPPILRVGTYGRGCWEMQLAAGPRLSLSANVAFGPVATGSTNTLVVRGYNTGDLPLNIISVDSAQAPPGITLEPFPTTWNKHQGVDLTFKFQPGAAAGHQRGFFVLNTSDPDRPAFKVFVSGSAVTAPLAPRLGLHPRALYFGPTTTSGKTLPGQLLNTGLAQLTLTSFSYAGGDKGFEDPTGAGLLAPVDPVGDRPYQVVFKPTRSYSVFFANPKFQGNYQVISNDVRSGAWFRPWS